MGTRKQLTEYYDLIDHYMTSIERDAKILCDKKIQTEEARIEKDMKDRFSEAKITKAKLHTSKGIHSKYLQKAKYKSIALKMTKDYINELVLSDNKYERLYGKLLKLQQRFIRKEEYDTLVQTIKDFFGHETVNNLDFTLDEVGKILNVTRKRVRQIESSAEKKLKHPNWGRQLRGYLYE